MKRILGVLFLIFGILCLPEVYSPNLATSIGRIIAISLMSFIPAFFLLRKSKMGKDPDYQIASDTSPRHNNILRTSLYLMGILLVCLLILGQIAQMVM